MHAFLCICRFIFCVLWVNVTRVFAQCSFIWSESRQDSATVIECLLYSLRKHNLWNCGMLIRDVDNQTKFTGQTFAAINWFHISQLNRYFIWLPCILLHWWWWWMTVSGMHFENYHIYRECFFDLSVVNVPIFTRRIPLAISVDINQNYIWIVDYIIITRPLSK